MIIKEETCFNARLMDRRRDEKQEREPDECQRSREEGQRDSIQYAHLTFM